MTQHLKPLHNKFVFFLPMAALFLLALMPASQSFAQTFYYNVTSYGANGNDKKDDTSAIQKALDEAVEGTNIVVQIPSGTYYISKTLYIQSNTTLKLSSDAKIVRSDSALSKNMLRTADGSHVSSGYGGYSLAHDITVTGGTWDGGNINKAKSTSNLIYMGHSSNITISNTTIKNCYGAHAIEFAGIQNGTIKNCKISGFRYGSDSYTSEAIQIDVCYKSGSTNWTPGFSTDKTACRNIVIEKNTITDYPRGIGSHHVLNGHYSQNVTIRNNKFLRSSASTQGKCMVGVFLMGVSHANISNNTVDHYYYGIMIKKSNYLTVRNNRLKYNPSGGVIFESCDRKNAKQMFLVTKDDINKKNFQFTCTGIKKGNIKTNGKTYKFTSKSGKVKLRLSKKIKANQQVNFYGCDSTGNKYYRIYYVPNKKKSKS